MEWFITSVFLISLNIYSQRIHKLVEQVNTEGCTQQHSPNWCKRWKSFKESSFINFRFCNVEFWHWWVEKCVYDFQMSPLNKKWFTLRSVSTNWVGGTSGRSHPGPPLTGTLLIVLAALKSLFILIIFKLIINWLIELLFYQINYF